MYFVKILRNSVRKNPEAEYNGCRKYARVGPRSFEIVLQMDRNLAKLIDYENETFLGLKYVNVRTVNKDLVEVVFSNALLLDNDKKDILMNWLSTNPDGLKNCYVDYVSSNVVDVTSAVPAPKYLYEYEPLDVTCKYCGATFDHSRLIEFWDDDCDIWREKVCPSCGKDNCVDIAYESLSDVLKEIGLK